MFFVPYIEKNHFYTQVNDIKNAIRDVKDFHDSGHISFVCDTPTSKVFDLEEPIKNFYIVQYAIVPSILKNDVENSYVVGVFSKKEKVPSGYTKLKQINPNTYLYKRIN